uniref:Uncharacterized protein n=1 Tax=Desulfovibrio sp. U5L TaxID=596152 RepID=I2PZC5_9BACT
MAQTEAGALASIKPSFCDPAGRPRYSVRDITRALGCGKREVAELERTFAGVGTGHTAESLMRVQ